MGEVVRFKLSKPSNLGFKKVERKKKSSAEKAGQLNLFGTQPRIKQITALASNFEKALLLDEQDSDLARDQYQLAIASGEHVADAYCNLGILEFRHGRLEAAWECFTQSLKANPDLFEGHYNMGNLYFHLNNLRPARVHYEIASKLDPSFAHVYYNLGLALAMEKKFDLAVEALTRYRDMVPAHESSAVEELLESLTVNAIPGT